MIAAVKTKITDGVVGITGITKKPVNQSGKTETPSDRLTLVSLSRAPGDADTGLWSTLLSYLFFLWGTCYLKGTILK